MDVLGAVRFPIDYDDRKPLGRTGEKLPAVGIGTYGIRDYRAAEEALTHAVELGLNLVDTAEMYDNGRAEELVGRVVRRVGRDNVFVTTKLLPSHFAECGRVVKAARASLRRLGIDVADLVLIHWPNPGVPIPLQIRCLERLASLGLARYIGVSNFDTDRLAEALVSTKKHEIVVDQVKYSPLDRRVEEGLLDMCVARGITLQAYTPIERGAVANNIVLKKIAQRYGKTPVQVALNYLISRPGVVAIPKTERVRRVEEFRGALGWRLDKTDIALIERLF